MKDIDLGHFPSSPNSSLRLILTVTTICILVFHLSIFHMTFLYRCSMGSSCNPTNWGRLSAPRRPPPRPLSTSLRRQLLLVWAPLVPTTTSNRGLWCGGSHAGEAHYSLTHHILITRYIIIHIQLCLHKWEISNQFSQMILTSTAFIPWGFVRLFILLSTTSDFSPCSGSTHKVGINIHVSFLNLFHAGRIAQAMCKDSKSKRCVFPVARNTDKPFRMTLPKSVVTYPECSSQYQHGDCCVHLPC